MSYSMQWHDQVVYCKFSGAVTTEDLLASNLSLYGQPGFDDLRLQIFDMLDAVEIRFTADDVQKIAAYDRAAAKINPNMKCALIARDEIALDLSAAYQQATVNSPWQGKAFRRLDEAIVWGLADLGWPARSLLRQALGESACPG